MNLLISLISFLFIPILSITAFPSSSSPRNVEKVGVTGASPEFPPLYPATASRTSAVSYLLSHISPSIATSHLGHFTSFHTRLHSTSSGQAAAVWLRDTLSSFQGFKSSGATVELFKHSWKQNSVIAKIPASSSSSSSTNNTTVSQSSSVVVLGAHIDSVNLWLPFMLRAPGSNDNASGVVSLLEAFRLLLFRSEGTRHHEVHFHFYSGEEAGIIGSYDIFKSYHSSRTDVIAALVLDMTGTKIAFGAPIVASVIEDYVDSNLARYIHMLAETYLVNSTSPTTTAKEDVVVRYAKCGYACSDHASASRFGYRGALVTSFFTAMGDKQSKYVHEHDSSDSVGNTEMESVLLHAKLAFAFAYELSRFQDVPPRDQRKEIEMAFGDGFSGYMIRWCAARSTDPLGVGLWVAVVIAVLCWLRIWRELAVLWPPMKRVMFLLLMFTARIIGGVIKLIKRKTRGRYQYDRLPMT